ncbi:sugar kinase [Pedobacter deserti]|uniref:sugar kinase n=1 Tax=Pedobacter deserti TaxID=2817382 RepID=UPI00210CB906|nr:sugar kinase [Pedobacter sp. SYSU D00382]
MQTKDNVLIFGELLLRLSSAAEHFIASDQAVSIYPGGSEANVAASLGQWGIPVSYLSCVPDNPLTSNVLSYLEELNVDISKTIKAEGRLGLYFLLSANGLSSGEVVYDRKHSSFSNLKPGTIDWNEVMKGHTWFHWTAITPALSEHAALLCQEALQAARANNLTISVDLNYRSRLWDYGKEPIAVMPGLVDHCDVIMGNIWAANKMLGTSINSSVGRHTSVDDLRMEAAKCATEIFDLFPRCKHIAQTFRFMDQPTHNLFHGTYHNREGHYHSPVHETQRVVDRIGSGDAFMAGFIAALLSNAGGQKIAEYATNAGYRKLFVKGDFGNGTI